MTPTLPPPCPAWCQTAHSEANGWDHADDVNREYVRTCYRDVTHGALTASIMQSVDSLRGDLRVDEPVVWIEPYEISLQEASALAADLVELIGMIK